MDSLDQTAGFLQYVDQNFRVCIADLTTTQRSEITTATNDASFSLDYLGGTLGSLADVKKLTLFAKAASIAGPALGALGPLVALIAVFFNADNALLEYLEQEFAACFSHPMPSITRQRLSFIVSR